MQLQPLIEDSTPEPKPIIHFVWYTGGAERKELAENLAMYGDIPIIEATPKPADIDPINIGEHRKPTEVKANPEAIPELENETPWQRGEIPKNNETTWIPGVINPTKKDKRENKDNVTDSDNQNNYENKDKNKNKNEHNNEAENEASTEVKNDKSPTSSFYQSLKKQVKETLQTAQKLFATYKEGIQEFHDATSKDQSVVVCFIDIDTLNDYIELAKNTNADNYDKKLHIVGDNDKKLDDKLAKKMPEQSRFFDETNIYSKTPKDSVVPNEKLATLIGHQRVGYCKAELPQWVRETYVNIDAYLYEQRANNSEANALENTGLTADSHKLISKNQRLAIEDDTNILRQSQVASNLNSTKDLGEPNIIAGCELQKGDDKIVMCVKQYDKPTLFGNLQTPHLEYSAFKEVLDENNNVKYMPLSGKQLADDYNLDMGKLYGNKDGSDFKYPLPYEDKVKIRDSFELDNMSKLAIEAPEQTAELAQTNVVTQERQSLEVATSNRRKSAP